MSAAAKAEARRKAILSRGTDRLSKLTTSARGDDAPQFVHAGKPRRTPFFNLPVYTTMADPPSPYSGPQGNLDNFLGESLPAPLVSNQPSRRAPDPHTTPLDTPPGLGSSPPDPAAWSNEQQQQFLQALLGGPPLTGPQPLAINASAANSAVPDDPLLTLMSSLGVGVGGGGEYHPPTEAKLKSHMQKLLPLLHVIAVWALVAFFIFQQEPEAFQARNAAVVSSGDIWNRWARLATGAAEQSTWSIEIVVSRPWVAATSPDLTSTTAIFLGFHHSRACT